MGELVRGLPFKLIHKLGEEYWDRLTEAQREILTRILEAMDPIKEVIEAFLDDKEFIEAFVDESKAPTKEAVVFRLMVQHELSILKALVDLALRRSESRRTYDWRHRLWRRIAAFARH